MGILHTISIIFGSCVDAVFEFERRATYFGLLRANTYEHILACQNEFDPK